MSQKGLLSTKKAWFYFVLILLVIGYRFYDNYREQKEIKTRAEKVFKPRQQPVPPAATPRQQTSGTTAIAGIEELTNQEVVINYLKKHGRLPDYYLTKSKARKGGWVAAKNNLCNVLPGKAIGGDVFSNFERRLPVKKGRKYYEADINYNCGKRTAERLVYSNDGLIYISPDHYQSFQKYER